MKYIAKVDNYGYLGRFWRADEVLDWHEGMPKPPPHFEPAEKPAVNEEPKAQGRGSPAKEFVCQICGAVFGNPRQYGDHKKTHETGETSGTGQTGGNEDPPAGGAGSSTSSEKAGAAE